MKTALTEITEAIARTIAVIVGFVMVGIGFILMSFLALFSLAAIGLAIIVAPLFRKHARNTDKQNIWYREVPLS
ncbi:MAG: hypothetical protein AAF478_03660 [Pseudomonadota bacterium]